MAALNERWGVRPFRAAFVLSYTARCIIGTNAARGIIKLLGDKNHSEKLPLDIVLQMPHSSFHEDRRRSQQNSA